MLHLRFLSRIPHSPTLIQPRTLRTITLRGLTSSTKRFAQAPSIASHTPHNEPPPEQKQQSKKVSQKDGGTIASVFATLSGGSLDTQLPPRFSRLKRSLIHSPEHARLLQKTWSEVLISLKRKMNEIVEAQASYIPEIKYPGDAIASNPAKGLTEWMDQETLEAVKNRGVVVVRNVVSPEKALKWKVDFQRYASENPNMRGFPDENPQVYESYWSRSQVAARSHPALLNTSRALLSLFHAPAQITPAINNCSSLALSRSASLGSPLTYADRLRIRLPGDSQFALGPHIDGGGVERWECETFRGVWSSILKGGWKEHDSWSLGMNGERMDARTDMYGGPGQCGVFRPLQGWLSMSSTGESEGTLRVLPWLRETTAYIILRPFFQPKSLNGRAPNATEDHSENFLDESNWSFDNSSSDFPGCTLGVRIDLQR